MNTNKKIAGMIDRNVLLSTLWIFVLFNYLYCDVLSNMEAEVLKGLMTGQIESLQITQGFLLLAGILMEIPIAMVLLSRVLRYSANRWANIIAGAIMTAVQISSFFVGTTPPTLHYIFYSIIEISCTSVIVWFAWTWRNAEV